MNQVVRIATRKSPLALWQANHVGALLKERYGAQIQLVEMSTAGDRFLAAPLSQIGGKGLFVKEIEQAVLDGSADIAVHSAKDMTSTIPDGLVLACIPEREDPRDAFVGHQVRRLADLPQGATIGTASLRRGCQLRERRPDLNIVTLRGNVQSRIRKMEEQNLAGAILAVAGLRRLGLEARITEILEPEISLPAVGQGALGIECRANDSRLREWLAGLEDRTTRIAVTAERAFLGRLEGGCSVPLAAHARLRGDELHLAGLIGRPDGTKVVRDERVGRPEDAARMGTELAEALLAAGGREILTEVAAATAAAEAARR